MNPARLLRGCLLAAAAFNGTAALAFAFPAFLGPLVGLPSAPPLYTTLVAFFIALFGCSYGWLALQQVVHRPMVGFAAIGKGCAFLVFLVLWLSGEASLLLLLLAAVGDLFFSAVFFWWLCETATKP